MSSNLLTRQEKKLVLLGTQESQNSISSKSSKTQRDKQDINQDNNKRIENKSDKEKLMKSNAKMIADDEKRMMARREESSEQDEGYTLRSQSEYDDDNVRQKQQGPVDCSESGIVLYSDIDDDSNNDYENQHDDNEIHDIGHQSSNHKKNPCQQSQYESRIQVVSDEQQPPIDFTPENISNLHSSQAKSNTGNNKQQIILSKRFQKQDISYNDTLSYLQDMLGSTYLDGLTKPQQQYQPPKIQCTAAYIQKQQPLPSKRKTNQIINKSPLTTIKQTKPLKINLQKKTQSDLLNKDQKNLQKSNKNSVLVDNINKQIVNKNDKKDNVILFKKQQPIKGQQQKPSQQQIVMAKSSPNTNNLESQGQKPLKKRNLVSKNVDVNLNNEVVLNKFIHTQNNNTIHTSTNQDSSVPIINKKPQQTLARKFLEDQVVSRQKIKENQQKKYKDKPKKVYVQKQLQPKSKQVNGWFYPDRGNVMYDRKVRPWVLQGQLSQQQQYYEGLIKKEYITQLQRQSLQSYLIRMNNRFTPPPYLPPFGMVDQTGTMYYDHSSIHHPQYQQPNYVNYPPPHMITNAYTQTATDQLYRNISSFLQNNHSGMHQSNSTISTKTMPIRENTVNGGYNERSQHMHQNQNQHHQHQHQAPVRKQNYVMTAKLQSVKQKTPKYDNVLPSNILETSKSSPPVAIIKQMSKPDNKSQVFVIYDVPVVVSNENIKTLSADIFLLPYCKIMLVDKCASKWIKCLQKMTGINIIEKLQLMNQRQIKSKGHQIPDGTLNRIRVNESTSQKLNFRTLYLVKLTTLIDQGSKNPYGHRLLKDVIDKVIQNLVNGILNRSSIGKPQTSLLIHGGFFPGIKRQDTPRLISYFLSIALANASLQYKRTGAKPKKIFIHVTKEQQYEVYIKQMRKIMLEYRKLQNL